MDVPSILQPLEYHGVVFRSRTGKNLVGDCPFCGKDRHFYAHKETGQWDCKKCGESGNMFSFLDKIADYHKETTSVKDRKRLSRLRGLPSGVFRQWDMALDDQGRWLIPVRNYKGAITDIRWWTKEKGRIMSTKGCSTGLLGAENMSDEETKSETVYICEGEWDAMSLDWFLRKLKKPGIAVAVPGAGTFKRSWITWFTGRDVVLIYDNDRSGDDGAIKVGKALDGTAASVKYVCWPDTRPDGYDLRDFILEAIDSGKLRAAWNTFNKLTRDKQRRTLDAPKFKRKKRKPISLKKLLATFHQWVKMTKDMEDALLVMLATVFMTRMGGRPLWMFIVGPPGCGKTLLLESFSQSAYAKFQSSLTPKSLVSGWTGSAEDPSLVPKLDGKTLVLKDYTEILRMNQTAQDEILATLRGIWDGTVEKSYGQGANRSYRSHFHILAGVTSAIHGSSSASLGERFLKYQMYRDTHDFDSEIMATISNIGKELEQEDALSMAVNDFLEHEFDMSSKRLQAMMPAWFRKRVVGISHVIAHLRADVTRDWKTDEIRFKEQQAEAGTRLGLQLSKLALGLCFVLGKTVIDEEVYVRMERVAFDTAIGFSADVLQVIMNHGGSASREQIGEATFIPTTTLGRKLEDLMILNVITKKKGKTKLHRGVRFTYAATAHMKKHWLMAEVQSDYVERGTQVRKYQRKFPRNTKRKD